MWIGDTSGSYAITDGGLLQPQFLAWMSEEGAFSQAGLGAISNQWSPWPTVRVRVRVRYKSVFAILRGHVEGGGEMQCSLLEAQQSAAL